MTIDFTNLDTYNRRAEQKIREALGSGVVRDEWPREQGFWRWIIATVAAGIAVGVFLAWVLT